MISCAIFPAEMWSFDFATPVLSLSKGSGRMENVPSKRLWHVMQRSHINLFMMDLQSNRFPPSSEKRFAAGPSAGCIRYERTAVAYARCRSREKLSPTSQYRQNEMILSAGEFHLDRRFSGALVSRWASQRGKVG